MSDFIRKGLRILIVGGDPAQFVTKDSVISFMNTGISPIDVLRVNILNISPDQFADSGIFGFTDWERGDVTVVH